MNEGGKERNDIMSPYEKDQLNSSGHGSNHDDTAQDQRPQEDANAEPATSNLDVSVQDNTSADDRDAYMSINLSSEVVGEITNTNLSNHKENCNESDNFQDKRQMPPSKSPTSPPQMPKSQSCLSPPIHPSTIAPSTSKNHSLIPQRRFASKPSMNNNNNSNNLTIIPPPPPPPPPLNESPRPKIPTSRQRRNRRSTSAPLSSGQLSQILEKSTTTKNTNTGGNFKENVKSLVLSNEVLAIPARKRSISTHSGGGANVTFETLLRQVALEEDERSKKRELRRKKEMITGQNRYLHRMRIETDTSEITMEGIEPIDGHSSSNIRKVDSKIDDEEGNKQNNDAKILDNQGENYDNPPLGFAMERFLQAGIFVGKDGSDVEVEDAPDALKAVTPAGVLLVNRADPRSIPMIQEREDENYSGDSGSSSILSELQIAPDISDGLGQDEVEIGTREQSRLDEEESLSDGSIFEDTIGLDKQMNTNTKDTSDLVYSGSSTSGYPTSSVSPHESVLLNGKDKDLPLHPKRRSDEKNINGDSLINTTANSSMATADNLESANQPPIKRRIRPAVTGVNRKKKNPDESRIAQSINVQGFEYDKNDFIPKSERKKKTKNGKTKSQKIVHDFYGRQIPQHTQQAYYQHSEEEYRFLIENHSQKKNFNQSGRKKHPKKYQGRRGERNAQKSYQSSSKISVPENPLSKRAKSFVPDVVTLGTNVLDQDDFEKGLLVGKKNHIHALQRSRGVESFIDSIFSSVRSVSTGDIEEDLNDSENYFQGSILGRAFPERFFALLVTLLIEVPAILMIFGGGDKLSLHMGQNQYQLLLAFLPLICAISGNCGLQSSTLTTRGITHSNVTKASLRNWILMELGTSLILGISMGCILGLFAYQTSDKNFHFGLAIACSQLLSVFFAGLTGSLSPLVSSMFFHQDSGKWGGLLETAFQDVISCISIVFVFYYIFVWPYESMVDVDNSISR